MDVIKFTLSGKTAFFKKPDVNTFYYFTYGCIHKIALLGILGSICGYGGYSSQKLNKDQTYPEFYEKLKNIKIGIVPRNQNGYIPKKIQVFNNSIGYANKHKGGNLIVKEQWLENPIWDIYILLNNKEYDDLKERLLTLRYKYIPYLGKNDHMANITDVKVITNVEKNNNTDKIDSLFINEYFQITKEDYDLFNIEETSQQIENTFKYEEMLPITLDETTNKYNMDDFIYTNQKLCSLKDSITYKCNGRNIFFF